MPIPHIKRVKRANDTAIDSTWLLCMAGSVIQSVVAPQPPPLTCRPLYRAIPHERFPMPGSSDITYSETRDVPAAAVLDLYRAHDWSSADKPVALLAALRGSHTLITAWRGGEETGDLVGLGNAISDGNLVVYYPHLLVSPSVQGYGAGRAIMDRLMARYAGFHQHMLVADRAAVGFYERCGFERAGETVPMWVYDGAEH